MIALLLALLAGAQASADDITVTGRLEQGGLVIAQVPPGSHVLFESHEVPVTPDGHVLLGFSRDAPASETLQVMPPGGDVEIRMLMIAPRQWEIQRIEGLPENLVTPDTATLARIAADNAALAQAFSHSEHIPFYLAGFALPVQGQISGVFGSQRVLNGVAREPHSGIDIAAPTGSPVQAAGDGRVLLAAPDMVLTGNTVVLDHGYGLETIYIHLTRMDVTTGQMVHRGDVIGTVGMTGRATGPNLHFGVTWYTTRVDPQTLLAVLPAR